MSKKCIFCDAPILSDYTIKVYWAVKRLGETTALNIAKDCEISIQQSNNYLSLLCQLNLLSRRRDRRYFVYRWHKY